MTAGPAAKRSYPYDAVAATVLRLDDDECRVLEETYRPHAVRGHR